ncbi:MAG: hypothetical protein ACTSUC_04200 [Promethearchaeota archaeon]
MSTKPIEIFGSYEYQLPIGFNQEVEHNWLYNIDRKLGRIYLSMLENPSGEIENVLDNFQEEMMESDISEYEFLDSDTINSSGKIGLIRNYRKNENDNKNNPYAVYTYQSFGVLKYDGRMFLVRSYSLGFNLNPTINNTLFQITKLEQINSAQQSTPNQSQTDLSNLTVFQSHAIAAPKKYRYEGDQSSEVLELRYKNSSNNITYYLTSQQLPANTDIGYYLNSYQSNLKNDGFSIRSIQYQGKQALYGKLQMQTAYIYQLHFVNDGKGQTVQMLAGKPSDEEFESYMNEIKIINCTPQKVKY